MLFVSSEGRLVTAIEKEKPTFGADEIVAKKRDSGSTSTVNRKEVRKNRWFAYSVIATLILLMVAFGMFLFRAPPSAKSPTSSTAIAASSGRPNASVPKKKPIVIAAGTLRRLATEVPLPRVPVDGAAVSESENEAAEFVAVGKPKMKSAPVKQNESPYGEPTVAPKLEFPEKSKPRLRLEIVQPESSTQFFSDAYSRAFESYEAFIAMDESAKDSKPYRQQLSQTLANVKAAFALVRGPDSAVRRDELLYLLAYLSLDAGHLEEAMIYGEMAARFGAPKEQASRDAAFIALAAAQEAVATQWGVPDPGGELQQMWLIAKLVDEKWPKDPQRDAVWMTLAQSYSAFGHFDSAIDAYKAIKPDSAEYAAAQIAIGNAYWTLFLIEASEPDAVPEKMVQRLKQATESLERGVSKIEASGTKPTLALVSVKLTLATIADRLGDQESVLKWLTKGKFPLVDSIRVKDPGAAKTVLVPEAFAKNVFFLLYQSRVNSGDHQGATASLAAMQKVLGNEADEQLSKLYLSSVVKLVNECLNQKDVTLANVKALDQSLSAMRSNAKGLSVEDELWIAQSWSKLGGVASAPDVSKACFDRAIKAAKELLASESLPKSSAASVNMLLSGWLRQSGQLQESLEAILKILNETPNVIELQRQAALTLEELAISKDSEVDLRKAIKGGDADIPSGDKSVLSATWGWSKFAQKLHQLRYSDHGTEQTAETLVESHFHLARCRWMLIQVLPEGSEKASLRKQTIQQLASARLAIVHGSEMESAWTGAFDQLEKNLKGKN